MQTILFMLIPAVLLAVSVAFCAVAVARGASRRRAVAVQLLSFIIIAMVCLFMPLTASAQTVEPDENAAAVADNGIRYIGAALAVGLSGIGGGIAVAAGAPAAIGANVEDPKSFGKSIIFVALGEGFGIYGLIISIMCLRL